MNEGTDELASIRHRLRELEEERTALTRRLSKLTARSGAEHFISNVSPAVSKIALFRKLFAGREDVFPVRWENIKAQRSGYAPACANEWRRGICEKPRIKCGECPNQAFIRVTDEVIESHLRGERRITGRPSPFVAGVYPLLQDESCWFLAADFDGEHWAVDALAYVETCRKAGISAALERSRSGEGGHVWIFFAEPVPARDARQLGAFLVTETLERRPELGFSSYDRFFPSQDTLPSGGFGNLIALPLQREAREYGNSIFVDDELRPHDDQWQFLASLSRLTGTSLRRLIADAEARDRVLRVRTPVGDESEDEPWRASPSRKRPPETLLGPFPSKVKLVLADEVYVDRTALPTAAVAALMRIAAFQNPEFYRAQAMRLPTFGKPRVVSCASLHPRHVSLPRGCLDEVVALLQACGAAVETDDQRENGVELDVRFVGTLREDQRSATDALARHDCGVLAATTAFGKTVVAGSMIALRGRSTLILVHRRELLTQWVERLRTFLSAGPDDIGVIGGGRRKPSGRIDVAVIQSLVRKGRVSDLVSGYGHLVVDECHHLSASSFELVARRSKARYVLGLSATVTRKDGHHPIIFMQCGPVRYKVDARSQAARRNFAHRVRIRQTKFAFLAESAGERPRMPALYGALSDDEERNSLIFDDVLTALEAGRTPLVLTERREHLERLAERFARFTRNLVVLRGGMAARDRRAATEALRAAGNDERLILATGRYLGEGFDDARLDTLFLAMPISWRGTLAQYVGRLHRDHARKNEVVVYDYMDAAVPVLARMAARRRAGYRALGYEIVQD